ncbi:MAG: hypothetical protein OES09_04945 [Gammaproteobacteria bacterium]|nr:hypothetical protein [Gammaproteobacteria bacterium]
MSADRVLPTAIVTIAINWFLTSPVFAGEVNFLDLPFGATRSAINKLSSNKIPGPAGIAYYPRREKNMRFSGAQLYEVYYGFSADRLVAVETSTFRLQPVNGSCIKNPEIKAISKKIRQLFGPRIRHVGIASSPEEYDMNYEDFEMCMNAFPSAYSCEVDVFENWRSGAKNTERALEATMHEVSFGLPVQECIVRLIFRRGRTLADKLAE